MFDTDSDTLRDIEPIGTEEPKASSADSAADAAKKAADAEKREKRRARQKRQAFTEQMQNLTMDDIRRLMESSVDLGGVSDPQTEIERRIERNGMAYLMKAAPCMPSCSQATTTNASRTRRRKADNTRRRAKMAATGTRWRPFSCHARILKPPRRHGVRRAETLATDTAERLPAATRCAPADSRKHRIGQPRGLSRQAANPKRSRSLLAARHDLERHPDMAASLRKQLVDRRRVVHGIAPGREQVEHGGHPLDDTGAIVGIHMTLLLIAKSNLYRRDVIQVRSGMQPLDGIASNSNATTDGINAGSISAHNDRCKAV